MGNCVRWLVLSACLLVSCAHSSYRAPQPTATRDGVTLTIGAEQRCFVTRDDEKLPPPANDNRIHLSATLLIQNQSEHVVRMAPGQVRLAANGGGKGTSGQIPPLGSTVVAVPPGESRIVPLDFEGPGPIDCHRPLELDLRNAVTMADRPVWLAPIRLVAAR